jgi:ankyrin repeat protein
MRLLPPKLLHQVMDLLENVARNDHDVHWQGTAAFQLAFALVCGLDTRQRDSLSLALEMLLLAATAGDIEAQATVGWIHETFGKRMDASNNQELDWLYRATTLGFPTARRHLFQLDRQAHDDAIYELCHEDGTTSKQMFRGRWPDLWELEYAYIPLWKAGREVQPAILHYYASIGLTEAISLVTENLNIDVNELGPQDATPLSLACRSGHLNAVRVLLHLGADPKIADAAGTTPLHWLSFFHESEMRELVQLLLQHGAEIEVRSKPTTMHISQDSTLLHVGRHGGTPLLWAVANFSFPATQALLDSGADPWDEAGEEAPRSNRFGNNVHLSPVHFAARGHMDEILELLLRNQANPDILNTHYRVMGSAEQSFAILPLGWAVTYGGFGMLEAISWHGKNYKSACQRTIELLLKHGANPTRLTSDGHSALELASQWGQGFAISFLEPFLTQNFVPTASIFRTCIKHAIVRGDTEVFDALINITRKVTPIVLDDISLLSFASTRSDSTHFLTTLLDSGVQVGQPQGTTIFEQALAQGNYEIATLFHDRGLFDPVCYDRFDFDLGTVKEGRFTVLGKLLISTIFSSSLLRAVHFVLERLPYEDTSSTEPSPAFWIERKDHLSALHLAAFIHEFRKDLTQGSETMDKLLYLFNQVHHLNSRCKIYGFTPLHLAVYCGNIPAIRTLLGEDDVDRQSLDDLGRTPMDVALFRHYEDTDTETMDALLSWMPPGWRPSPRSQIGRGIRSKRNVEVLSELMGQNLQTKKYLSVVIRDSEEAVSIITPNNIVENRLTLISVPSGERRSPSSKSIPSSHLLVSPILNERRPLFSITSKPRWQPLTSSRSSRTSRNSAESLLTKARGHGSRRGEVPQVL